MSGQHVTLHVLQGTAHTEFALTATSSYTAGDPVLDAASYPVTGVDRTFIESVCRRMGVMLTSGLKVLSPGTWVDHVSYEGWRTDPPRNPQNPLKEQRR